MSRLFQKFKEGLKKQAPAFHQAFGHLFSGTGLDHAALETLEALLYTADFGVDTVAAILQEIQSASKANPDIPAEQAARIGVEVLIRLLEGAEGHVEFGKHKPEVIALVGVNGSGKTTTAAKLGHLFRNQGYSVLLGACDTFRAAANEQLLHWAEKLDIDIVTSQSGADPAAVAFDACHAARSRSRDIVLLDTAGRLHTKNNLMKELEKFERVIRKQDETAPHHRWMVIDGSLGANSIEQARVFNQSFPLTGLIITKLDGSSRGGAIAGIYRELKLPIYFVGLGEQPDDLQPFSVRNYANAIFGITDEN